jgi:ketol-acid reductoisomerase
LVQHGWDVSAEGLKHGGITNMMDRLSNPSKLVANSLAEELKTIMAPLYKKHMDDIITGNFSEGMMADWADDDAKLLGWREATTESAFEKSIPGDMDIPEQEYYENGILMVAMVKAGVELAFESMTSSGIIKESAYYESLHEVPLIANLIGRKKLYEMNKVISDTAEYGCYLFSHACVPLLEDFMKTVDTDVIGKGLQISDMGVDNAELISVNDEIRSHPIEVVGKQLRKYMTAMKKLV